MQFLETHPSDHLSHFVKSFWRMSCDLPNHKEIITRDIPNGDFHVLFNLGTAFKNRRDNKDFLYQNGIVKGQQSQYLKIVQSNGCDMVGISFHPWGLYPFTKIPSKEFYKQIVNVNDVFEPALEEKLLGLQFHEQVSLLKSYLMKKLDNYKSKSYLVELLASDIIANKGQVKIANYLQKYNISQKHLTRCFHELVGLSPKKLAGLCRVNAVIDSIKVPNDTIDWIDVVVKENYYDHSHMIKDFKKVVGLTPENFIKAGDSIYQRFYSHLKIF
ncbi:MAG: DUF6597 domain-containing transcriptional factor [Cytophagaceae bacterium]